MADRIAYEIHRRAYVPALGRARFVLIETDVPMGEIDQTDRQLSPELREFLSKRVPATYLLTGSVAFTGIYTIKLKLIDLQTGIIVWTGDARDNPAWVWTRAHRSVGEIPAVEVRSSLGFAEEETPVPAPEVEHLPHHILMQPLHTTEYLPLAADCEMHFKNAIQRDGLFSLVPGALKGRQGHERFARISPDLRRQASETTLAEAILTGSLLVLGKDGSMDNFGVVLRLIDVETGQILWMGSSTGRRVWRWDKIADIVSATIGRLGEDFAQYGAGAAETQIAALRDHAKDGKSWSVLGHAYLERGLLKQAEETFEKAMIFPDAQAEASAGKGLVLLRRGGHFDDGVQALRSAIRTDPDYLDAYSYLAQALLDQGMINGVKIAENAIRRDSTYLPPYRVLGDWYADREDHQRARGFYQTYLTRNPDDEVAERLGRSLLQLKNYRDIDRFIAPIARDKPEASHLLPIMAIKALRVKRFEESAQLFERFLAQINARERQLYDDIQVLLSNEEIGTYRTLNDAEKKNYVVRFWRAKNPNLSSAYNERQLAHYERVWMARWAFGRENYPWDRRGEVYIRYGEPDYRARSGWISSLPSTRVQEVKEKVYRELYRDPNESELIGPVFPIRSDRGFAAEREREMLDIPDQNTFGSVDGHSEGASRSDPSQEAYAPVTMQHDRSIVPWESWVYTEVDGGMVIDFTRELGGVSGFDFAPIPPIPPTMLRDNIRIAEHAPAIRYKNATVSQSDEFRKAPRLSLGTFYFDLVDFRGSAGKTRVDIISGIPLENLLVVTDGQHPQVVLERAVALTDSAYRVVYRNAQKVQYFVDTSNVITREVVDITRQDVPAGLYHLSLTVTDAMTARQGVFAIDVTIDEYDEKQLHISDLLLVKSLSDTLRDTRFRRGNWQVVPNPRRTVRAPNPLAFYCEVYNLAKDEFGQTRYRVTTAVKATETEQRRGRGNVDQPEVALSYTQVGNSDWERLPLEVHLEHAQAGQNRLFVIIEDLVAGTRVAKDTFFQYIR
ncbi:MAG: GWxTD domain-containing protein [Gemmatimonadota bacterium]|nr:GWxTD domain-containing protein [Gemmatimonadota bacterium]MDE2952966.1 GWxTD domain-containing protein [Gemmatimonadota bacterium]